MWLVNVYLNLETVAFKALEPVFQVVDIWEALAAVDENRLDGLLGGLLCVEAIVFQVNVWVGFLCQDEVAPGSVEPFARVVRREPFTRHTRPFPPSWRGKLPGNACRDSAPLPPE